MKTNSVAVIGAGVVGLSTAVCIQQSIQSSEVTIVADKFLDETLSIGAGGLFRPEINVGPSIDVCQKWCKDSYNHFTRLAVSREAGHAGAQLVSGYHLSSVGDNACRNLVLENLVPDMRKVPTSEIHRLFDSKYEHGYFYTTPIIDQRYYLSWLQQKFISNGGTCVKKTVKDLTTDQVLCQFDAIVNCTGLGAKELVGDWHMTPIRGQTIKVKAPWIKHFFHADGIYIIPASDGLVTLGGIKTYGDWNGSVSVDDRDYIWRKCIELVPCLEKAEVCFEWCGLRPFRMPVRVEGELIAVGTKQMPVVHNYGHGAHGVSLSWGTALHATKILQDLLSTKIGEQSKL